MKQTRANSAACRVVAVSLADPSSLSPGTREKLLLVTKPLASEPVKPNPHYQMAG